MLKYSNHAIVGAEYHRGGGVLVDGWKEGSRGEDRPLGVETPDLFAGGRIKGVEDAVDRAD